MGSVSLVNHELAALMQPLLWEVVNLNRPIDWLVYFVDTILPRHALLIHSVSVSQHNDEQSISEGKSLLQARAIASMPKLTAVILYMSRLPDPDDCPLTHFYDRQNPCRPFAISEGCRPRNLTTLALASLGDRLKELSLHNVGYSSLKDDELAPLLSQFPFLSHFTLNVGLDDDRRRDRFNSTLASLRHLTFLDVSLKHFDTEGFVNAAWECPLKTLRLRVPPSFSLPSFATLLSNFSSTLDTLILTIDPVPTTYDADAPLTGPPFTLPHLHTLSLYTFYAAPFLAYFDLCPVRHLTIWCCPDISGEAWADFIRFHAATLRSVTLSQYSSMWLSSKFSSLPMLCETNGIEFESFREP